MELALALKLAFVEGDPFDSDSSCPISRHRDPKGPSSYHWTQEADEHSVGLIGFRNFQLHFLDQMKIKIVYRKLLPNRNALWNIVFV